MFTFTNNLILMSTSNNSNSFISNSNFTFITILPNQLLSMLSPTILVNLCNHFNHLFVTPPAIFSLIFCQLFHFATTCQSNSTTYFTFRFFCNLSPASNQLNSFFFQQPALQPNFSIPIQQFHFSCFFGSDVLSADCPSWRGAM